MYKFHVVENERARKVYHVRCRIDEREEFSPFGDLEIYEDGKVPVIFFYPYIEKVRWSDVLMKYVGDDDAKEKDERDVREAFEKWKET